MASFGFGGGGFGSPAPAAGGFGNNQAQPNTFQQQAAFTPTQSTFGGAAQQQTFGGAATGGFGTASSPGTFGVRSFLCTHATITNAYIENVMALARKFNAQTKAKVKETSNGRVSSFVCSFVRLFACRLPAPSPCLLNHLNFHCMDESYTEIQYRA